MTATAGVGLLVFSIINTTEAGWSSPVTLVSVPAGLVLLAVFVVNERRAAQPIMPLRLLASRERAGAYLARFFYLGGEVHGGHVELRRRQASGDGSTHTSPVNVSAGPLAVGGFREISIGSSSCFVVYPKSWRRRH